MGQSKNKKEEIEMSDMLFKLRLNIFLIGTVAAILSFISKLVTESEEVITYKRLYEMWERLYIRFLGIAITFFSIGVLTFPFGNLLKTILVSLKRIG